MQKLNVDEEIVRVTEPRQLVLVYGI